MKGLKGEVFIQRNKAAAEEVSASTEEMAAQVEEMAVSATLLAKSAEQLHQAAARFRVDKEEAQITSRRRQSDWNSETAGKAQGNHTPKLRVVNRLW